MSPPSLSRSRARPDALLLTASAAALLAGGIAVLVLLGWYAKMPALIRVSPKFVAMQFNTALALLLVSVAVAMVAWERDESRAWLPALVVLALGGATLAEHLTGRGLGIDLLLFRLGVDPAAMRAFTEYRQPAAGRMAPNSALSFTLLGLALVAGRSWRGSAAFMALRLLCCLTAAVLGFVAASGYLLGIPTEYGWGNLTRMAVHTAASVTLLGIGAAAAIVWAARTAGRGVSRWWAPFAAGAVGFALSLSLWQALADDERRQVEREMQHRTRGMAQDIGDALEQRGRLAGELAGRLADHGAAARAEPSALAREGGRASAVFPDVRGIGRTSHGVTRWWGEDAPLGLAREVASRTRVHGRPVLSRPFTARSGDRQVLIAAADASGGTAYVVVSVRRLAEAELHVSRTSATALAISDGGAPVLTLGRSEAPWARAAEARRSVRMLGRTWDVRARPTGASIRGVTSGVPVVFLVTALVASVLAALTVGIVQRERGQSAALAATAQALAAERDVVEAANRAKSVFLARMSHELRTPLNSVIGFAKVLITKRAEALAEADRHLVSRIHANGTHLLTLINQVLDIARIESGHETVTIAPTDVRSVVEHAVASFDGKASWPGIQLSVVEDGILPSIDTDASKLLQVLINLLGNAYKFTPAPGVITVRLTGGADPRIDVQDSGIGIPPERQAAIFEAFEQADPQISQTYGGTGLGLAISRELCALLGHALTLHSVPGEGSTFTISFTPAAGHLPASSQPAHSRLPLVATAGAPEG